MDDWIGLYKGLRLPLLGMLLIAIAWYLYRPRNRDRIEEARFRMLEDEFTPKEEVDKLKQNEKIRRHHV
ncbi:MAG: CcoQ/FixQ family Cbb3-type cytochrome c oxidase assembly chaperone [Candidatus Hydrogenedentota bacterium]|nr:MAG: CcoQ/FixQ family Cbb3-type cytochrome c oxidase assembly chaperone [Candidatus Hydrogenedentota bacterium]